LHTLVILFGGGGNTFFYRNDVLPHTEMLIHFTQACKTQTQRAHCAEDAGVASQMMLGGDVANDKSRAG